MHQYTCNQQSANALLQKKNVYDTCDHVRENEPYVVKNVFVFRRISEKYRLMDLRCKFGVDCLLSARDIATFICAIVKINNPKTAIIR